MAELSDILSVIAEALGPYDPDEAVVEALRTLLDNRYEGLIVVDAEGRVVYMNRENERFLGLARGAAKGRHITDLIPSSRLHVVCQTGRAEVGHLQEIEGKTKVVARIPLRRDGRVVGAMGSIMFRDLREVDRLARKVRVLEDQVASYQRKLRQLPQRNRYTFDNILGRGRRLREAVDLAKRVARSDADVLLVGETGTGKELFAHAIHNESPRAHGPFVRLNCAAIPRDLAESELFGYEPGSFSGADRKGRIGKFEQAHGGTIFLDEIGELPLDIQAKLLRVLQEREVERLGGTGPRYVDFRLVAATNVDLKDLVEAGRFRADLYFRMNRMLVYLPPLRDHPEDIPLYVEHFLETHYDFEGTGKRRMAPEALAALQAYPWPGNVRELQNVVERVAWNATGPEIRLADLPPQILTADPAARAAGGEGEGTLLRQAVEEAEKRVIRRVLQITGGNKKRACELLGIHRATLYQKLARYGEK
ncbi:sigma-54 interaction domain-containing protein [Deferrisoma camini]|uniref:sigma-54 interaction domain-containing protein n=1 Tax=Deferrisoma camini TaxID=1035120 RepID=UPI00046CEA34|nr:sigma-54-dependent Fis family transcriptional regulator [Deferrisoma camini]